MALGYKALCAEEKKMKEIDDHKRNIFSVHGLNRCMGDILMPSGRS
jgi:hypothetical protein